jgi:hypothetical protein
MRDRKNWQRIGEIGVDAGLCWVGDPCYLKSGKLPWEDWLKFCEEIDGITQQFNYPQGRAGLGVLSGTGYGDGTYPVYARIEQGRVMELRVVFDEDPEED